MTDETKYVEHPRFGTSPNFTGLNPDHMDPEVELHWNSTSIEEIQARHKALTGQELPFLSSMVGFSKRFPDKKRIPNTAIVADPSRYAGDPLYLDCTHYFDLQERCQGCRSLFLFYAEEQKYWYEVLKLPLEAYAKHCVPCRKKKQRDGFAAKRYKALSHVKPRSIEEDLEMAKCALELVDRRLGASKLLNRVKILLNRVRNKTTKPELLEQARELETKASALTKS